VKIAQRPTITTVMDGLQTGQVALLSEELRLALLDNLSDGVYFVDRERRILYWNRGAEQITGFSAGEVLGRRCKDNVLNHCDGAGTVLCGGGCPLLATIGDGSQREAHVYLRHKDGHRLPVCVRSAPIRAADGTIVGAVETFHDDSAFVGNSRRAAAMARTSLSDPLTGVGNRRLGEATLLGWVQQHERLGRSFGVLFIDVDRFKQINDRFGHDAGDEALRVIARTLVHASRRGDEVVRWGGEEFLMMLADADAPTLGLVAERLRVLVKRTRLVAERQTVLLSVSIGGTLAALGDAPELILRRAVRGIIAETVASSISAHRRETQRQGP
jgi:diguanylate cyclase (GGDEF)-like protein/PAS domain S-box-containing protein